MEREDGGEGEGLGDRVADDVSAIRHILSDTPADPDPQLLDLLDVGRRSLGSPVGIIALLDGAGLRTRVATGPEAPEADGLLDDPRIDTALERQVTVAALATGAEPGASTALARSRAVVAGPLWVDGQVAGAVAFWADGRTEPFTAWQLAVVDLVADGAARVLERHAATRREAPAEAIVAHLPDTVVCLDRAGCVVSGAGGSGARFDPFDGLVGAEGTGAADRAARVRAAVERVLDHGDAVTEIFVADRGAAGHHLEARFVPTEADRVLCIVRDVSEQHRTEAVLAEQVAFKAMVTALSTRLISAEPLAIDATLASGLGEVADFFHADTATVHELSADGAALRVAHHWSRLRPVTLQRGDLLPAADHLWLREHFRDGGGVVFARHPPATVSDPACPLLVPDDDRGGLWVRLGYGGELVGVLTLRWRTHEPPDSAEALWLIRFAADAFLGAMRRRRDAMLASGQAEVFERIARGAPVDTALLGARDLLAQHILGASVLVVAVDATQRLQLAADPEAPGDDRLASWLANRPLDLSDPFGQAVITGEPVAVADIATDPRFAADALPEPRHRSASILPARSPRTGRTLGLVVLLGSERGAPSVPEPVRQSVLSLVTVALERSLDERRLAHQATHDPLTGVGNRAALIDRLTLALARARRSDREVGVLFCDLDGFKSVNDRFGHDRGDRLLVEVANRISGAVRPSDTVCRTGGDEFVVVCEDLADRDQIHAIAARVRLAIEAAPVDIGEALLPVSTSVGVAVADLLVDDPDRLLRTADLAMYASKQRRTLQQADRPVIDLTDGSGGDLRREPLGPELVEALEAGTLQLAHQPLVGRDGALAGVEVLLRWHHPTLGPIAPEQILAAAANDDLTIRLGRWVRRTGLAHRQRWQTAQGSTMVVPVHVNIEGIELASPHFVDAVLADLAEAHVGPEVLVLEVREEHLGTPAARAVVRRLAAQGVAVLVEGAGQGGLPLAELAELPVRGLKLARPLVARIQEADPTGLEVARSLVLLAHGLGWRSLAVGVETDHQRAVLFGFGVDAVQGRAVTMPITADQLVSWLATRSAS